MVIRCTIKPTDNRALQRHILYRYRKIHWLYLAMLILVLTLVWFGGDADDTLAEKGFFLLGATIVFGGMALVFRVLIWLLNLIVRAPLGGTLGDHEFAITETGITETNSQGKIETLIAGIKGIRETSDHFFIVTKAGFGHVVPKRDLTDFTNLRELQSRVAQATA